MYGKECVEVPDHEVVTRRMQFQAKKDNAEEKRQKKAEKKIEKEQKKQEKLAEKNAKMAAKQAKKDLKTGQTKKTAAKSMPRKTGRTAAKKAESWKPSCVKKTTRKKKVANEDPVDDQGSPELSTPAGMSEQKSSPVKSRQMKKLKKMKKAASRKTATGDITPEKTCPHLEKNSEEAKSAQEEKVEEKGRIEEKDEAMAEETSKDTTIEEKAEAGKGKKKVSKDKKRIAEKTERTKKTKASEKKSRSAEGEVKQAKRSKKSQEKSDQASKSKSQEEKKKKKGDKTDQADQEKAKKSRKKEPKQVKEVPVNEGVKGLVLETLKECKSSHCTHPSFVKPTMPAGSCVSPYWTRNTVGVVVPKRLVKNAESRKTKEVRKTRGEAKKNIAYFSGDTPCIYTNYVLAGIFVPW